MLINDWIKVNTVILLSCINFHEVISQCVTTEGGVGTCISVLECPELLSLLVFSSRPLATNVTEKLKKSQCGYEGNYPKVCCSEVSCPPIDGRFHDGTPNPPDVTQHPNLGLLPTNCGESSSERIIGGNTTEPLDFPWMALISYRTGDKLSFNCGGTIINSRYILTAAHCITAASSIRTLAGVRVGEHDISTVEDCVGVGRQRYCVKYQEFGIEHAISHPGYAQRQWKDDIGLIRLSEPINFTGNVAPICLPTSPVLSNMILEDKIMEVAGWGFTENGHTSSQLLIANLPVVRNSQCNRVYRRSVPRGINYTQVCAGGEGGVDSCNGDSGGPLKIFTRVGPTIRYVQYGIVSFGTSICAQPGWPGVYTRIPYYLDWILDTIKP